MNFMQKRGKSVKRYDTNADKPDKLPTVRPGMTISGVPPEGTIVPSKDRKAPHAVPGAGQINRKGGVDYSCLAGTMPSPTDTLGSYTGVPTDGSLRPVQDADDL